MMIIKKTGYGNKFSPFKFASVLLLILGMLCLPVTYLSADPIKFATLAPQGSTWMNNFEAMAKEIRSKTDTKLRLRIYPNGVQGDELDVIRKMQTGLLHAGAMTATGLGEIQKEVLIFQLPRLFKNYEELDYVRDYLREDLDKAFMEAGYVLIGMGDIGFHYIFSNQPITTIADLQAPTIKMWARTSDRIALEFYKNSNIPTVSREVTQVLSSLYSGQINVVTASPYVTVALQWYDKLKYMTNLPVHVSVAAIVMTKEKFDQLPPDQQKVLREVGDKYQSTLTKQVRKDNDRAIEALQKKAGLQIVEFEQDSREAWDAIAIETHKALVGQIYSQTFLDKINELLEEYRKNNNKAWDGTTLLSDTRPINGQLPAQTPQTPQQIAKNALAATVLIVMEDAKGQPLSTGSGFFVKRGIIATNLHVVEGVFNGYVKRVGMDRTYRIEGIVAMDSLQDLVLIRISDVDSFVLPLGSSDNVQVGESVYVAGNPIGFLEGTFSNGIVSGVREFRVGSKRIQITAPISEGSSGGPVLNSKGEVIGVAVSTITAGQNLNFAIPSNYLSKLLNKVTDRR